MHYLSLSLRSRKSLLEFASSDLALPNQEQLFSDIKIVSVQDQVAPAWIRCLGGSEKQFEKYKIIIQ